MSDTTRTGENFRRLRGKATQQQMAFELPIAKSTVGAYERGTRTIPPDVASMAMTKWDDPRLAIDAANEYTSGGWAPWLDGPAFDNHHSSVKSKTYEELLEALDAINLACLNKHPDYLSNFEKQDIEKSLDECADAITALNIYLSTICNEYQISWLKVWSKHKAKLLSKGFLKLMKGADV